jgi:hypothetical protein
MKSWHRFRFISGHINPVKFHYGATMKHNPPAQIISTGLFYLLNSDSYVFFVPIEQNWHESCYMNIETSHRLEIPNEHKLQLFRFYRFVT